ncbi:MAG: hypothetical protein JSU79_02135, partial [Dehalococcoidales bacterium]
ISRQQRITITGQIKQIKKADVSSASLITLYLTTEINDYLIKNIYDSINPEARIVTYCFPIPGWNISNMLDLKSITFPEGKYVGKLFLYQKPHIY